MKLITLLKDISYDLIMGQPNQEVDSIIYDSRIKTTNGLFIAIKGFSTDGHKYIDAAIENGAKTIVVEDEVEIKKEGITVIKVDNTRTVMARLAVNFYDNPSKKLSLVGVTGTNGKTSITFLLGQLLEAYNKKIGIIGTIENRIGSTILKSQHTTPESADLQKLLATMVDEEVSHCLMEVSSHALALHRVDECAFKVGMFTNLTQDHLDFHKDLDDYRKAKEKLFFKTTMANIINIDDEGGKKIYENIKGINVPCYTYGVDTKADFMARDIKSDSDGVSYRLITPSYEEVIFIPVPGMFTVYNTLAVIAACYVLGIPKPIYKEGLRLSNGVSGRFETVPNDKGISVIVDYAHTPDALENVLKTTQQFAEGKIISVFGCGGDRDTEKRPLMGSIGQKYSDLCIITSDNPRTEEPEAIIKDILEGIDKKKENYHVVVDRKQAIAEAISMAKKDDVVIITGKGHETYQIIGKVKHHFDDKEVANECLSKM